MIQVKQFHFEHTHLQVDKKDFHLFYALSNMIFGNYYSINYYHKNSKTNLIKSSIKHFNKQLRRTGKTIHLSAQVKNYK